MVLLVMLVPVRVGVTGAGMTVAATMIPAGCGGPSTDPQSSMVRVLLSNVTPLTWSLGALECTTMPGMNESVTVLPWTVTEETEVPGVSAATTMPPMTGPCGPNFPTVPITVLLVTVAEVIPAPAVIAVALVVVHGHVASGRERPRVGGAGIDMAVVGHPDAAVGQVATHGVSGNRRIRYPDQLDGLVLGDPRRRRHAVARHCRVGDVESACVLGEDPVVVGTRYGGVVDGDTGDPRADIDAEIASGGVSRTGDRLAGGGDDRGGQAGATGGRAGRQSAGNAGGPERGDQHPCASESRDSKCGDTDEACQVLVLHCFLPIAAMPN